MSAVATVVELRPEPHAVGSYDPEHKLTPTAEQYASFEAACRHFNIELFGGTLPPAMLTLAKSGRSFGYYIGKRWRNRGDRDGRVGEIALNPEHLARDERAVAATLVHELVHHWQQVEGTPSRRGYHNKEWASKMEAVGLMPSNTGEPGAKKTGQRMTHYIIEDGAFARAFDKLGRGPLLPFIAGSEATKDKPAPKPDPSKTKFTCLSCGDSARGKPSLEIACRKCSVNFVADGARVETAPPAARPAAAKPSRSDVVEPLEPQAQDEPGEEVDWTAVDNAFDDAAP